MEAPETVLPALKTEELWIVPTGGRRTIAQIRADPAFGGAPGHRFPENMPLGPHGFGLKGRLAMLNAQKDWSRSYGDGGAFSTIFAGGFDKAVLRGKKGARQGFCCSCFGKPPPVIADSVRTKASCKTNCPFYVSAEESSEGWVASHMHKDALALETFHNHPLVSNLVEANAALGGGLRDIPLDLCEKAGFMSKHHIRPGEIYSALVRECQDLGQEVTFTKQDVMNKFAATAVERSMDATGLISKLKQRYNLNGLMYDFEVSDDEGLTRLFYEAKGARELWESCGGKVVILDTKHGTQRYGLKLACVVTVDRNGTTRILAVALLRHEDDASFAWLLQCFESCFGSRPGVIFTDSDYAMALAISVWPGVTHLLCTWHLFKNFYENLHPLFTGKADAWHELAGMWWKLCKNSDTLAKDSFGTSWARIVDFFKEHVPDSDNRTKKLKWLAGLAAKKEQWAACWTWAFCTYGVHSTQRIEALHSAINVWCNKSMLLTELFDELESREAMRRQHSATQAFRDSFKLAARNTQVFAPVAALSDTLTAYALEMAFAQAAQFIHYTAVATDVVGVYLVRRIAGTFERGPSAAAAAATASSVHGDNFQVDHGLDADPTPRHTSLTTCSCQLRTVLGILCRHIICVMWKESCTDLPVDAVDSFWHACAETELALTTRVRPRVPLLPPSVQLTPAEREAELKSEFSALAQLASSRSDWFRAVQRVMQEQFRVMSVEASAIETDGATAVELVPCPVLAGAAGARQNQARFGSKVPGAPGGKKSHKKKK
jgi:hypothetical protein